MKTLATHNERKRVRQKILRLKPSLTLDAVQNVFDKIVWLEDLKELERVIDKGFERAREEESE